MAIRAVLVSLVLHAGVAYALSEWTTRPPPPPPALEPLAITVLPAGEMPRPEGPAATERRPGATEPGSARRRASRESAGAAAPATEPRGGGGDVGLMRMRLPGTATGARSSEVVVPRPWDLGGREAAPPSGQLAPGAMGGPTRAPRPYVPVADPTRRDLGHGVTPDGDGGYKEDRARYSSRIDRDGSIHFHDKGNLQVDGIEGIGIAGSFDLTEAVMRALGDDPYAYEKMKIMEETRGVRIGMAQRERSARFREAQRVMTSYLDKVWEHAAWTPAERRRALFALWDEAAEEGDAELLRAADMARATIEAYVRRRLPAGSADAFSERELIEMNRARRSRHRFEPYSK